MGGATRTMLVAVLVGTATFARDGHSPEVERRAHPRGRGLMTVEVFFDHICGLDLGT